MWQLFPNSAVFALVLGTFVLANGFWRFRFYSLAKLMVWPFLAQSAYPPLVSTLR